MVAQTTTEMATALKLPPQRIAGRNPSNNYGVVLEKQPQFSSSIFSPTMSPPLDQIGFKIPDGRKTSQRRSDGSRGKIVSATIEITLRIIL